jgi:hypothetical protein
MKDKRQQTKKTRIIFSDRRAEGKSGSSIFESKKSEVPEIGLIDSTWDP